MKVAPFINVKREFHLNATKTRPRAVSGRNWALRQHYAKYQPTATPAATDDGAAGSVSGTRCREFPRHSRPDGRRRSSSP